MESAKPKELNVHLCDLLVWNSFDKCFNFGAPVLCVKKKHGSMHMCIDQEIKQGYGEQ